jgi:hypothetical protein
MVSVLFSERRTDVAFEMRCVVGHEVRQFAMLCVTPSWLDRVQLWRIGGQPLNIDVLQSRGGEPFGGRAMHRPAVPADDQLPTAMMAKLFHKGDYFVSPNVALVNLKRRADVTSGGRERDSSDHAQPVVPVPGSLHGRLAARGPGAAIHRLKLKPGFIDKNNAGAASTGFFLIRGQSCRRHRSTACESCSRATRRGFWGEKPRSCSTRPMWAGWYETPNCLRTTSETRAHVHKSVRYPAATGPWRRILVNAPLCFSQSLGSGPGCGLAAKPSTPSAFHVFFQRFTLVKLTPKSEAIFRRGSRSWKCSAARRRRASSSAALPGGLIKHNTLLAAARVL